MLSYKLGNKRHYYKGLPETPFAVNDGDLVFASMPHQEISVFLQNPTFFLFTLNGRSKGKIGHDTDALRDFDGTGGEYIMSQGGQEFAIEGRNYSGATVVRFSDAFLERLDIPGGAKETLDSVRPVGDDPQLHHIMTALRMTLDANENSPLYREFLATAAVLRLANASGNRIPTLRTSIPASTDANMRRAEEYMRANLSENVSLSAIAEAAGLSSAYFWKSFKAWKGVTAHEHLKNLRLNKARRLLKETNMTVLRIALECGYNHQSHFGQTFKARFGVSPTQYRRDDC